MSKYTNPLDEFQSHSIHYVVLAARSTEELRAFTDTSDVAMSASLQAIDSTKQIGNAVKLPGKTDESVFLMIDTRRFSQFSISDFSMHTLMAGLTVPGSSSPNSVAQEMSFTVVDSMGISFANFLQFLMDKKLQVSFEGMSLLVKVLFIGSNAAGTTKIIQSVGIPAFFSDIEVDLNESKGIYRCKCIPLVGMVSNSRKNAKWTSIGTASQYFTGLGANTLGAIVNSFEKRLNDESFKRYAQFNGKTPGESSKTTRYGRPVEFMITLPKGWSDFAFSGPTQGGSTEINFKELLKTEEENRAKSAAEQQKKAQTNSTSVAKDSFVSVHPDLTITEVLDKIFSQTVQVAKLGNFTRTQNEANEIKFYKHLVSVTSNDVSYTVHVDIVEYIVPNAELKTKSGGTALNSADSRLFEEVQDGARKIRVPKNFLEFDYIFSGKNLDVLNLDLKIEHLNYTLMQGNRLGQGNLFSTADVGQKQANGESVGVDIRTTQGMAAKDPVLIPQRTGDERSNFSNLNANLQLEGDTPQAIRQQYIRNISDFYNAGPLKAKMTIRGNPTLLDRVSLNTLPQHVSSLSITNDGGISSTLNTNVKQEYRTAFEADLLRMEPRLSQAPGGGFKVNAVLHGPSHLTSPIFIKVNVFGPNVDFITNEVNSAIYAERLFYNNYYYLFSVLSKIDGSKFTQEFDLAPYSVYGHANITAQGQNTSTVKQV